MTKFEQEFGLSINEEGKIVTSSLKVAEYYIKEHADVLKKIRGFIKLIPELGLGNFSESSYINEQGKRQPMFIMDRQGFSMLVNKFTGDEATLFTFRYTKAFEEMAEEITDKREYIQVITDKIVQDKVLTLDDLNRIRFSTGRTIKTFTTADMKTIDDLVHDFNEYVSNMDATTRMKRCKSAIDGIERLHDRLIEDNHSNIGHCYNLKQLIIDIKDYRHKIENKKNGGVRAALRRENNKVRQANEVLTDKIDYLTPDLEDYYLIDYSPYSENYMYEQLSNGRWVKTKAFKNWITNFPYEDLPYDTGIDWNKPIKMYLAFVHKKGTDIPNLHKGVIDLIFKHYGHDDYKIEDVDIRATRIGTVNSHKDGKIYFMLRNV
jgi:Rha family phage regulatory protein